MSTTDGVSRTLLSEHESLPPRRKGASARLLLRVSRSSLPLKDYCPGEIKDYCYIDCFLRRGKKGRVHCLLLHPAKRQPSLDEFRRQMVCAAHSCPGMNCSQPRRIGATVRLLLRVSRSSLPLKDYYLGEIKDNYNSKTAANIG